MAYPKPFDEERSRGWIEWNLPNYKAYGFGLWAVCRYCKWYKKIKEYPDEKNVISYAYAIKREEWEKIRR